MGKSRQRTTLLLPWEHRSRWLQGSFTRSRVQSALIVAIVVAGLCVLYAVCMRHVRQRESRIAIDQVHRAIAAFRRDVHRCPNTTDELIHPPTPGRRYLQELPVDGWGNPLYVRCPGRFDSDQPEVLSAGPSGSFLTDDNVR